MKIHARLLILLFALWPALAFAESSATIDNLQESVNDEANAVHRYALFAKKADEEGHAQVAKLFRAVSHSESIHLRNHEKVLRDLGIEPKPPVIEDVEVRTTRENLEEPVKVEAKEAAKTYPAFVKQSRRDKVPTATLSFNYALNSEAQHKKLFKDALSKLGHNPPADYYVGKVSGATGTRPLGREPYTKID